MKRILWVCLLIFGLFLSWTLVYAGDFYVIPTKKKNYAPVEKTGQTKCYDTRDTEISCNNTGQNGDLEKGVVWPIPRFADNWNGTVKDNLTGLMWTKDANLAKGELATLEDAINYIGTEGRVVRSHQK